MSILHNKSSTLPSRANCLCQKILFIKGLQKAAEKRAHKKRQKQDLLNKGSLFDRLSCSCLPYLRKLYVYFIPFGTLCQKKCEIQIFLETKNRSIESQYVFDLIVVEFVIVSPSGASLVIQFKGAKSNQETGMLVKFLQIN